MSELLEDLGALARAGDWAEYHRRIRTSRGGPPKREDLTLPPPEHTSRDPWPDEVKVPTGAARLARLGFDAGWKARVSYSRGWRWGVGADQVRIHVVAVRLRHPEVGRFAVACWEAKTDAAKLAWKSDVAMIWEFGGIPHEVGVKALSAWVTGKAGDVPVAVDIPMDDLDDAPDTEPCQDSRLILEIRIGASA